MDRVAYYGNGIVSVIRRSLRRTERRMVFRLGRSGRVVRPANFRLKVVVVRPVVLRSLCTLGAVVTMWVVDMFA